MPRPGQRSATEPIRALRADVVVWLVLTLSAVLAAGIGAAGATDMVGWDATRVALRTAGLEHDGAGPGWLALAAAAVAIALVLGRRWLQGGGWLRLQVGYGVGAALWTAALVGLRHARYETSEAGTTLGTALSGTIRALADAHPLLAAAVVGVGAGLATVLLAAAVQSLSGEVQARRVAPVFALMAGAGFLADGATVLGLVAVSGVLALSAMASERGRGLAWSTSFGLLSGLLLVVSGLAGFACTAAGVGMLCIYFLRRRSLMIGVSGLGTLLALLVSFWAGWSWPDEFGAASAVRIESQAELASSAVLATLLIMSIGGPVLRASWRKVRGTPSWPIMLTGLLAPVLAVLTRPVEVSLVAAVVTWIPLLSVAASAPPRAAGTPTGPSDAMVLLTAGWAIAVTTWAALG